MTGRQAPIGVPANADSPASARAQSRQRGGCDQSASCAVVRPHPVHVTSIRFMAICRYSQTVYSDAAAVPANVTVLRPGRRSMVRTAMYPCELPDFAALT